MLPTPQLTKRLLSEDVFRHLASRIVDGDLTPGSHIRDMDVASQLHVSRTPVREALQRLERMGMVTIQPSRFTIVTPVSPDEITESTEAAGYYAGAVVRMALKHMTPEQREQAASIVDALRVGITDPAAAADARVALLTFLREHAGNRIYQVLSDDWVLVLRRNLRLLQSTPEEQAQVALACTGLHQAILSSDADEAERLARAIHLVT